MFVARRVVQQGFAHRGPSVDGALDQEIADGFGTGSTAWFAGTNDIDPRRLQGLYQAQGLGRLTSALAAFEGYEPTAGHG